MNLPAEDLAARSLQAYLRQEIRAVQMDVADLQDRYSVDSADALRAQIEQGKVHSHPAWEDAIEWENLQGHLNRLAKMYKG